jgi:hypothetical protein
MVPLGLLFGVAFQRAPISGPGQDLKFEPLSPFLNAKISVQPSALSTSVSPVICIADRSRLCRTFLLSAAKLLFVDK